MMRNMLLGLLTMALGALAGAAGAAEAASVEGSWNGSGTVRLKSGDVEPVRCRIGYEASTGRTFVITVSCAHANGTFKQSGRIVQISNSSYTGSLYSDQYSVSGDISVKVSGKRQTLTAKSAKGTATVVLSKQ